MEIVWTTLVETHELASTLGSPDLVVLDCRHTLSDPNWGEKQYREGHIPGAHFVHLDRDLSGPINGRNGRHPLPELQQFAALLANLGIGPHAQVVVCDQGSSLMSGRAWWMLHWAGHERAAVLNGGYSRWTAEGRPVTTEVPGPPVRAVIPPPAISMQTVSADYVQAHLQEPELTLIDARGRDRFRGETEPMDPVAGHIPGALNRPYTENLGPDGRFKPPPLLRAEFEQLLEGRDPGSVVHQCGSGVSACHNILAMKLSGIDNALTLYPGSWSEWCSDPSRPTATGP